jgi:PAS domain S-box-containing protein
MASQPKKRTNDVEKTKRMVFDNLIDAIWIVDAETLVYEYITPSIEKISGYTPDELINTCIIDRMSPESISRAQALLEDCRKALEEGNEENQILELELKHKNNSTYWVEIRARFVKNPDESLKIIGISKDITNRKLEEADRQNLIIKLKEALAEKENLIKDIRLLSTLLPVCSGCRRIRDENGKWWPLDAYIQHTMGSDITHTICQDCKAIFYKNL